MDLPSARGNLQPYGQEVSPVGESESLPAHEVVPADLEVVAGPRGGWWRGQDQPLPHHFAGRPSAGREVAASDLAVVLAKAPPIRTDEVDEEVVVLRHRLRRAPVQGQTGPAILRSRPVRVQ